MDTDFISIKYNGKRRSRIHPADASWRKVCRLSIPGPPDCHQAVLENIYEHKVRSWI